MAKRNIPVDLFYASYTCDCTYVLNSRMNIAPYFSIILHSDSPQIETFLFSSISALSAFFVYLTYLRMREIEA